MHLSVAYAVTLKARCGWLRTSGHWTLLAGMYKATCRLLKVFRTQVYLIMHYNDAFEFASGNPDAQGNNHENACTHSRFNPQYGATCTSLRSTLC